MNSRKLGFVASFVFVLPVLGSNVVKDWNTVGSASIVASGGKSPAAAGVWFSYVSLAMYDAVNSITGGYQSNTIPRMSCVWQLIDLHRKGQK